MAAVTALKIFFLTLPVAAVISMSEPSSSIAEGCFVSYVYRPLLCDPHALPWPKVRCPVEDCRSRCPRCIHSNCLMTTTFVLLQWAIAPRSPIGATNLMLHLRLTALRASCQPVCCGPQWWHWGCRMFCVSCLAVLRCGLLAEAGARVVLCVPRYHVLETGPTSGPWM